MKARMMIRKNIALFLGVIVVGGSLIWLPPFIITLINYIGLYSIVALGLIFLTGIGGMMSFGQAAFVGLGAYCTAWVGTSPLVIQLGLPQMFLPWLGLGLGLVVTMSLAWATGLVTLSLSGHYLALATLAWAICLYYIFGNIEWLGGFTGITGIPGLNILGFDISSSRLYSVVILCVVITAIILLNNLLDSRCGRAIRALRNNRIVAETVGVNTGRERMKVFLAAAILASLSGWLYAHYQRFVNPTPFDINMSIEYLFMAVVGGIRFLWGAIIGAAVITGFKELLDEIIARIFNSVGSFELIAFGVGMLLLMQKIPNGFSSIIIDRCQFIKERSNVDGIQREAGVEGTNHVLSWNNVSDVKLEAVKIGKRFGGLIANEDVSISVTSGQVHALIGPNGAGKSTLFDMISGVDEPDSGEIFLNQKRMNGLNPSAFARSGLARTFQHVKLLEDRSVLENVALGTYLQGRCGWIESMIRRDRGEEERLMVSAKEIIDLCGLTGYSGKMAGALPLGKQRIVEVARALAIKPKILLMDEPAAGLRQPEKESLGNLVIKLKNFGIGILIVEHDMRFIMGLADIVTVLEFGRVIAHDIPKNIRKNKRVIEAYLGGNLKNEK